MADGDPVTGRATGTEPALRVLVVDRSEALWGAQRSILGLAPLLAQAGIDPVLLAPAGGPLPAAWTALGLDHHPFDFPPHRGLRTPARAGVARGRPGAGTLAGEALAVARAAAGLRGAIRRSGADVVHSNTLWGHVETAVGGRLAQRPVVLELHDLVGPGVGRRLQRLAVGLAAASVAISRAVAEGAGPGVEVVPQAVDLGRFSPGPRDPELRRRLGADGEGPLVGILGRIDPGKGVETVVRALADPALAGRGARLAVVGAPFQGDPDFSRGVEDLAGELLGDRVRFLPPLEDVPAVLRCLDILVNASAAEPFGLTVLEAQATGTAVVATRTGGIPEFVSDGRNGLLVPPGDVGALAGALLRLLDHPELAGVLARAGRADAEAGHDLTGRAAALARVYRRVAR